MELIIFWGETNINQMIIQINVKRESERTLYDAMRLSNGPDSSFPVCVISFVVTEMHTYRGTQTHTHMHIYSAYSAYGICLYLHFLVKTLLPYDSMADYFSLT